MLTSATTVIWAERAGMAYDRRRYSLQHEEEAKQKQVVVREKQEAEMKSSFETFKQVVNEHKYSVILGSWATTMGIAWTIINRDKYMTFSQKIVQVRMWAQGVTIAMILATAVASQAERRAVKEHPPVDHSWMSQLKANPEETTTVRKVTTTS
ncbi:hypothetical protein FRC17_005948 [Serendipita sp. 399]|nr:hypothetical protein FRC17_005948 [Serendipita sp. 399]